MTTALPITDAEGRPLTPEEIVARRMRRLSGRCRAWLNFDPAYADVGAQNYGPMGSGSSVADFVGRVAAEVDMQRVLRAVPDRLLVDAGWYSHTNERVAGWAEAGKTLLYKLHGSTFGRYMAQHAIRLKGLPANDPGRIGVLDQLLRDCSWAMAEILEVGE